jgi:hypothetical protein
MSQERSGAISLSRIGGIRATRMRRTLLAASLICAPPALGAQKAVVRRGAHIGANSTVCTGGINIPTGTDTIQGVVNSLPVGATACLLSGTYRLTVPFTPKTGQSFVGVPGRTIIDGSKIIAGPWVPTSLNDHTYYVASAFLPAAPSSIGQCSMPQCTYAQDTFRDGVQLTRKQYVSQVVDDTSFVQDFASNQVWLYSDPTAHLIEQSYSNGLVKATAETGVTLQGIIFQKSANPAQTGAIQASGRGISNWVVDNDEIRYNHGAGLELASSTISNSHIHHMGQIGLVMTGSNTVLYHNEIDNNNTAGYNPGWEAGATKMVGTIDGSATYNDVHDNNGHGIWFDIDCFNTTVRNNNISNNAPYTGILVEISSTADIEFNILLNNGPTTPLQFFNGASILIVASSNVNVANNSVTTSANGIGLLQQVRREYCAHPFTGGTTYPDGTPICPNAPILGGSHITANVTVHNNYIIDSGASIHAFAGGMSNDTGRPDFTTSMGNTFQNNIYCLPNPSGAYWMWTYPPGQMVTSVWQQFGQDVTSTFRAYPSCKGPG